MQLASSRALREPPPAAMRLGGEKPHQGLSSKKPASHRGLNRCKSMTALWASQSWRPESVPGATVFRKYDPSAGRWMSPDPAGWFVVNQADPQSLNRYAYVENQPMNAVDPQGLEYCISSDGDLYTNGSSNTTCPNGWTDAGMAVIQMQTQQCPTCFLPPPPALADFTDSFDPLPYMGPAVNPDASALNNAWAFEKKAIACNISTMQHNGIATALDFASLGADAFGPEEQYAKLAIGLGLSTASTINSAANKDVTGAGLGMASYLKSTTELAANSAGWGWAKWIPFAGAAMDVASTYNDVKEGINYNLDCLEGH